VAAAPAPAAEQAGQQQLVLMVETNRIMKVFSSILRMKGYRVAEASDCAGARAFHPAGREIALVFSDILLPDRQRFGPGGGAGRAAARCQVVLTSGYTEDDTRLARIKERGYAFLPKPYNMHALLQILGETWRNNNVPRRSIEAMMKKQALSFKPFGQAIPGTTWSRCSARGAPAAAAGACPGACPRPSSGQARAQATRSRCTSWSRLKSPRVLVYDGSKPVGWCAVRAA